jgi:hypothetical protein
LQRTDKFTSKTKRFDWDILDVQNEFLVSPTSPSKSDLAEHFTFDIMSQPYAGEWAGGQNHGINSRTCFDDSSYADEFRRQARPQLLQFQVNTVYAFWNRD